MRFRTAAVIIGVNNAAGQARLRNAEHDAQDLAAFLQGPCGPMGREHVFLVTGSNATRRGVRSAFVAAAGLQPDLLVVAFSGHGSPDSVWLADGALSHRDLGDWIRSAGADRGAVIIDACHAAGFASEFGGEISGLPDESWQHLLARMLPGMRLLLASRVRETASDGPGRNGLFTAGLLDSFRMLPGDVVHDGVSYISAEAAFRRAAGFVVKHSKGKQSPVLQGRAADFPIARQQPKLSLSPQRPAARMAGPIGAHRGAPSRSVQPVAAGRVVAALLIATAVVYSVRNRPRWDRNVGRYRGRDGRFR